MEKSRAMKRDWVATARTLSEALPYLQRYAGAVVVVKFGGNAMGDDDAMADFARDVVLIALRASDQAQTPCRILERADHRAPPSGMRLGRPTGSRASSSPARHRRRR